MINFIIITSECVIISIFAVTIPLLVYKTIANGFVHLLLSLVLVYGRVRVILVDSV